MRHGRSLRPPGSLSFAGSWSWPARSADLPPTGFAGLPPARSGWAMTNSQPHIRKPSPAQLKYLDYLKDKTGTTFTWPKTFGQAHVEIDRLLVLPRSSKAERRLERDQLREDLATGRGDAATIRPDEIGGYGASATMLTSGHDREVKALMDQIRELHPRRGESEVCREAFFSCCDALRELSPLSFRRVMSELGGSAASA